MKKKQSEASMDEEKKRKGKGIKSRRKGDRRQKRRKDVKML